MLSALWMKRLETYTWTANLIIFSSHEWVSFNLSFYLSVFYLKNRLCACVHVRFGYVHVFMWVCTHLYGHIHVRPEVGSLLLSRRQDFPWTQSSPVSSGTLGMCLLLPSQCWDYRCMPPHPTLKGTWGSELRYHDCVAGTSLTEVSQTPYLMLFSMFWQIFC